MLLLKLVWSPIGADNVEGKGIEYSTTTSFYNVLIILLEKTFKPMSPKSQDENIIAYSYSWNLMLICDEFSQNFNITELKFLIVLRLRFN